MKRIAMTLLCLGAVACSGTESKIQDAVRERLIDPGSATFGAIQIAPDGNSACVAVNSRNRMGGYAGEQEAYVQRSSDGRWSVTEIPNEGCFANMAGASADESIDAVNRIMAEAQAQSDELNRVTSEAQAQPDALNTAR